MRTRAGRVPRATLSVVVVLLLFASSSQRALADGVVGTGTQDSCTEAELDNALAGGGRIAFNCGPGPLVITFTSEKAIVVDTSLDGGNLITLRRRK